MSSEDDSYTLQSQKIERLEKNKKLFQASIIMIIVIITPLLIYQGMYFHLLLILINIVASFFAFTQFISGLKRIYRNDSATEEKEMKLFLKIFLIAIPVATGTVLAYMYYLGLFKILF